MEIIRYQIKEPSLQPWVNFIWEMHLHNESVYNKLLPTDSIDLIINMGAPMVYVLGGEQITAPDIHINGLRSDFSYIYQTGLIHVLGISFVSFGLYPFIRIPMTRITDAIVSLHAMSSPLATQLERAVLDRPATADHIESVLVSHLLEDSIIVEKAELLRSFLAVGESCSIQSFCRQSAIHVKTFERLCQRYTGYTPTTLRRIHRFQVVSNQIVHEKPSNLADVAYANSYADQAHLIRDFKAFSGEAPRTFTKKKQSVKENARYRYG